MSRPNQSRPYSLTPLRRHHQGSLSSLAREIGRSVRTLHRWQTNGLTEADADHAAIALGLHPLIIWPDWIHSDHTQTRA